jgi:hypothetical protein
MAEQILFREVARNVDFPENAPWDFTSNLTGEPASGLPPGAHPNKGELLKKPTKNGNKINASYKGTLRIRDEPYKWTSIENSIEDGDGNVEGEEEVTWDPTPPGALPQPTKMHTKWRKDDKTVNNTGYK